MCRFLGGHKFLVLLGKYRDTIAGSYEYACCCCLATQLCQTLQPTDCSPPGSFVQGIFQARTFTHAEALLLCPTLYDPLDCSPPGSSVHEIFRARIMEWVAIFFSRGSSWHRDRTCVSCFGRLVLYSCATGKETVKLPLTQLLSFCFPCIPHPCQHLVVSVFQILAVLIGVWWYLIVISVCVSLMTWCEAYFHMLICHLSIIWRR